MKTDHTKARKTRLSRILPRRLAPAVIALAVPALTGCIDDKYDLSDVDTTVRVNVDNLTVPVNIDQVTLKSIMDLDADSKIKVVDGAYAYVDNGEFHSSGIRVSGIHIDAPVVEPSIATAEIPGNPFGSRRGGRRAPSYISVALQGTTTSFKAETDDVSTSISGIEKVGANMSLTINVSIPQLAGNLKTLRLSDVRLRVPRGMILSSTDGSYNISTGELTIPKLTCNGSSASISLTATGIDAAYSTLDFDEASHHISFTDQLALSSATLGINASDLTSLDIPSSLQIRTDFNFTPIDVTTFTGLINYDITDFNVKDVDVSNLPDVLSQEGTDLHLANPQIYFTISNPLSSLGLTAQTGMAITSFNGQNQTIGVYSPNEPYFTIGRNPSNTYCMSPLMPSQLYPGYSGAEHIAYTSLSDILSGDGLPKRLSVAFNDTKVPRQHVADFRLDHDYGSVDGTFTIVAPLEFAGGSRLIYTDTLDGWDSEDLDAVTIETLVVRATVNSDLPIELQLTGYPIDVEGNQISNVEVKGANVAANAKDQQVEIYITGSITHLDGLRFTATATPGEESAPLAPDMHIAITDIRPVVSGYYQKKL